MESRRAPDPALDALSRKLLWYGTAAAGAALAAAPDVSAQVLATRFDPPVIVGSDFDLDFDGDGDPEFTFHESASLLTIPSRGGGGDTLTGFIGREYCFQPGTCWYYYETVDFWRPLRAGVTVSADAPSLLNPGPPWFNYRQYFIYKGLDPVGWQEAGPSFIGLRFDLNFDLVHYGWVALHVPADGDEIRLRGYAYDATPDAPIVTGDTGTAVPAVTLDGSVNQTTFPAEGGTLAFTATVTNTTPEPELLDLWLVARWRGEVVEARRLGSGTLPGGATVTRTIETAVQAEAPAGTYDVRFHVGRYPAVVDTEAFTLTKLGAAGAPSRDNDLLEAAPVSGDLFAGAEAAATPAAPFGTAVLGGPSPNPSAGRVALPLTVAEPQQVRVTVHDALGREVAVLHDGALTGGAEHRLVFDGSALPSGVYVVRAVGKAFADARTVVLTR